MTEAHGGLPSGGENDISTGGDDTVEGNADRKSATRAATVDENVQDTTAEALFDELKTESDAAEPDVFEDASAETIVEDADGHDHEQYADGGEAIAAGDEIDSLLLPDRSDGEEFRWIETDPGEPSGDSDEETADDTGPFAEVDDLFAAEGTATDADEESIVESDADVESEGAAGDDDETTVDDREDSAAFPSTTPPQRTVDDESAGGEDTGSRDGIVARILSFFGLR